MNNTSRNPSFKPTQHEIDTVSKRARTDALKGGLAGGLAGALVGRKYKAKLIGAGLGATAGDMIGRRVGRREGARDVVQSRQALLRNNQLAELREQVNELAARAEERDHNGNNFPGSFPQPTMPMRKSVRGMRSVTGNGVSAEAEFFKLREDLTARYGWGVTSALEDSELTEENCQALHDAIVGKISKTNSPAAGLKSGEDFERAALKVHLGAKAVEAMGPAELHCHFLSAQRRGLVEFEDQDETTNFALINRERSADGTFEPNSATDPGAVRRAYSPTQRKTGIEATGTGIAAGAGLASAIAHLRGKKGKRPRLTGGSVPQLGFALADDDQRGHGARNAAIAGTAGALGLAGILALRKRRLRLPAGVPKLPPRTTPPQFDVETQVMSRRLPVLTSFVKGPGTYRIARATLRGKKQPGVPKLKIAGKKKPTNLAFLIHDDAFPLVPQPGQRLAPGMKRRVPFAKSRAEVLKRLKAITALSSQEFGAGAAVAEVLTDAASLGGLAGITPAQRRARQARLAQQQQNAASDSAMSGDATAQPRTLDSALDRLANMNFGIGDAVTRGAARFAPEVAAIGAGDVIGESVHDRLKAAQDKRKRRLMRQRGGVEQNTAISGNGPTALSSVHNTLVEFDRGRERMKRDATTAGAAGTGAVAGAIGGLKHDSGVPIRASDLQPGMRVTKRFGPGGLFQHVGIVDESGRVVHRTAGSSKLRSVAPSTFQKTGKGPLRHEVHADDLPPRQAAANASRASGTRAGRYSACQGNNCQDAAERLISRGKPVSRQLRKAIGGAAIGAAGAGAMAHILQNHKKKDQ
jgi:hypothetical protein